MAALGGAGLVPYGLGADRHGWVPWVPSTRRSREASRWREVSAPIRDAAWLAAPSRPTSSGWPCDPTPRLAMWSTQDPVTVFGVVKSSSGVDELGRIFRLLGSRFADGTADHFELVGAGVSGDLAYTVGYEHAAASMDGAPTQYTLGAT